jgi:hypothetical protein
MKLIGKIFRIFDTQTVSEKYKKREFVLEVAENPSFPQFIKLEFSGDKCILLDAFKVDQNVEVDINLKGRAWTSKEGKEQFFNTIEAWKIYAR